ncbi:hypothetical protein QQ045_018418 [Rhodiola kirilowii]
MICRRFSILQNRFQRLIRTLTVSACPTPLEQLTTACSDSEPDNKILCISVLDKLVRRGLTSSAQQMLPRIISHAPSAQDAISVCDYARMRGVPIDVRSYVVLVEKLVAFGEFKLVEGLYLDHLVGSGVEMDCQLLSCMIVCYCRLGKLEEALECFGRFLDEELLPSEFACQTLLSEFCARGRVLDAFQYFRLIDDLCNNLGFSNFGFIILESCSRGYLDEALYMFDKMQRQNGSYPGARLYKGLVLGFCRAGRLEEAEMLCCEMEENGYSVDKFMYTSVINGYCQKKKMKMALQLFLRMLKTGCEADTCTYNTLIHGFVNSGLFEKVWVLYDQMKASGSPPNVVTYQLMITRYCKEKKLDCAMTVINNMTKMYLTPNVHCFTVLLSALYMENRIVEADELYTKMIDCGVVPDHVLFFTLMKHFPKGMELQLAGKMLNDIAIKCLGLRTSSFSMSDEYSDGDIEWLVESIVEADGNTGIVAFGIFISALCAAGKPDSALVSLGKLLSLGYTPLLSAHNSLIKCLLQEGLVEEVKRYLEIMQERGVPPNMDTYLVMMKEYCDRGDLASGIDVLDQITRRGLVPNVAVYDTIIGCLSRKTRINDAKAMFTRMLEDGVVPDETVFVTMISGYSKNRWPLEAQKLFDSMIIHGVKPGKRAYTALICGFMRKNMIDMGCIYLEKMLKDGYEPNGVLYASIIKQYLRKGDLDLALRLINLMVINKVDYDLITHASLVCGLCRNSGCLSGKSSTRTYSKRKREKLYELLRQQTLLPVGCNVFQLSSSPQQVNDLSLRLIQEVEGKPGESSLYMYNELIYGFCGAGMINDAYKLFGLMQKQGVCPNEVTYTILIHGHIQFADIDQAVDIFNKMNMVGCVPDRIAHDTLLKGLCKSERLCDALCVSLAMHKRGFLPSKSSYELLLVCFCASYVSSFAFSVFEEMLTHRFLPSWYSCNWLLRILTKENKLHEAQMVHNTILLKKSLSVKSI